MISIAKSQSIASMKFFQDRDSVLADYYKRKVIPIYRIAERDALLQLVDTVMFMDSVQLSKIPVLEDSIEQIRENYDKEILKLQTEITIKIDKQKKLVINSIFLLIVIVLLIVLSVLLGRSRKKKLRLLTQKISENEELKLQNENLLKNWSAQLESKEAELSKVEAIKQKAELNLHKKNVEFIEAINLHNITINKLETEITIVKSELSLFQEREKDLKEKLIKLQHLNEENPKLEEKVRVLSHKIDSERESYLTLLNEKETLIESFRKEIRQLRDNIALIELDYKNIQDIKLHFENLKRENENLKFEKETYISLVDNYKKSLENELNARREFEQMLKEIINMKKK